MKVKEEAQKNKDKEFKNNLSYQEWLDYFHKEPTKKKIDVMEKSRSKKHWFFQPFNNRHYQPLQGA